MTIHEKKRIQELPQIWRKEFFNESDKAFREIASRIVDKALSSNGLYGERTSGFDRRPTLAIHLDKYGLEQAGADSILIEKLENNKGLLNGLAVAIGEQLRERPQEYQSYLKSQQAHLFVEYKASIYSDKQAANRSVDVGYASRFVLTVLDERFDMPLAV